MARTKTSSKEKESPTARLAIQKIARKSCPVTTGVKFKKSQQTKNRTLPNRQITRYLRPRTTRHFKIHDVCIVILYDIAVMKTSH
jgi:hypothetical protein